ncbi:Threonine dehydratase, mitochondrial [Beauveria bassiana]|nr:Threonine dehydratase, mitochondrial [Beauveria bassiana]
MPSLNGFEAPSPEGVVVSDEQQHVNGNGGDHNHHHHSTVAHRPKTPTTAAMALTEYSACPSPPSETAQARIKQVVPDEFLQPDGYPDYLRMILSATSRIYEACKATPLTHAVNLSNRLECAVLLKREDEQPVFSFKLRGAYNKMAHLDPARSWKGVVCCSAGNHAQGVAYSARKLKIPATIIMPEGTPSIKHTNVARLGGHVVLHGADFDAAKDECARRAAADGLINIPPFDDPYRPGAFTRLVEAVMPRPVTEFSYRYAEGSDVANVLVGISLAAPAPVQRADELRRLLERVREDGSMTATDLSADELAKSHIRYLGGGRAGVPNEKLFMFSFPERPAALERFLLAVRPKFNITLFQYRNYGGDVAKILAGIACPDGELPELLDYLNELGYPYQDCTDSEVYKTFLRT